MTATPNLSKKMAESETMSIRSYDLPEGVTLVFTVDKTQCLGLTLAGIEAKAQELQPKSNWQNFIDH